MMAVQSATMRAADQSDPAHERLVHRNANHAGAMAMQSDRGYEAAPQMFVRLTGSHLARPRTAVRVTAVRGLNPHCVK